MSDLRSRCLTAMVDAMVDVGPDRPLDDYAVACLDALLEMLAASPNEWLEASWAYPALRAELRLVQALKPTTEEG